MMSNKNISSNTRILVESLPENRDVRPKKSTIRRCASTAVTEPFDPPHGHPRDPRSRTGSRLPVFSVHELQELQRSLGQNVIYHPLQGVLLLILYSNKIRAKCAECGELFDLIRLSSL